MVRLKAFFSSSVSNASAFQFLVVRLKEGLENVADYVFFEFQFLVVRLKALAVLLCLLQLRISIPCGSIKRQLPACRAKMTRISIPCGSIKSLLIKKWGNKTYISIPCGSIKSFLMMLSLLEMTDFNSLWFD